MISLFYFFTHICIPIKPPQFYVQAQNCISYHIMQVRDIRIATRYRALAILPAASHYYCSRYTDCYALRALAILRSFGNRPARFTRMSFFLMNVMPFHKRSFFHASMKKLCLLMAYIAHILSGAENPNKSIPFSSTLRVIARRAI